MMNLIKTSISKSSSICEIANINENNHQSNQYVKLLNSPEVFMMNFDCNGVSSRMDILKMLITIPLKFDVDNLFS